MAGYLENYGRDEQRRGRIRRRAIASVVVILVGVFTWWILYRWDKLEIVRQPRIARFAQRLRNHNQERLVRGFFTLLGQGDWKGAYAMWGCTDSRPCPAYPASSFAEDWVSQSAIRDARIVASRSCGSGVIVTVNVSGNRQEYLWVQRSDSAIAFSPFGDVCDVPVIRAQ